LQLAEKIVANEHQKTPIQIKQKVQELLMRKGYSFTIMEQVLDKIELSKDDEEWAEIIQQQGDKIWRKYAHKYSDYHLKMRVKQALYQKGFPIEKIDTYIEQKE
jgi:RecX family.